MLNTTHLTHIHTYIPTNMFLSIFICDKEGFQVGNGTTSGKEDEEHTYGRSGSLKVYYVKLH